MKLLFLCEFKYNENYYKKKKEIGFLTMVKGIIKDCKQKAI